MLWPHVSHVGTSYTSPAITVYSPAHFFLADNIIYLLCQEHGRLQKGNLSPAGCTRSKDKQKILQQLQLMYGFLAVAGHAPTRHVLAGPCEPITGEPHRVPCPQSQGRHGWAENTDQAAHP